MPSLRLLSASGTTVPATTALRWRWPPRWVGSVKLNSDWYRQRGVVVGVGAHSGRLALQTGIAEATARKCPLTAVYVWDLQFSPTFGGSVDPDGEELAEATRWATRFWPTR